MQQTSVGGTMNPTGDRGPLGIITEKLSEAQLGMLKRIDDFDLWFVAERLRNSTIIPEANVDNSIRGFKQYIALAALGYDFLPVPSEEIDEVWHSFILFTREYQFFCEKAIGNFIHHAPRTSRSPLPQSAADPVTIYRDFFGDSAPQLRTACGEETCCSSGCSGSCRAALADSGSPR